MCVLSTMLGGGCVGGEGLHVGLTTEPSTLKGGLGWGCMQHNRHSRCPLHDCLEHRERSPRKYVPCAVCVSPLLLYLLLALGSSAYQHIGEPCRTVTCMGHGSSYLVWEACFNWGCWGCMQHLAGGAYSSTITTGDAHCMIAALALALCSSGAL
jgi:hypothetical protein